MKTKKEATALGNHVAWPFWLKEKGRSVLRQQVCLAAEQTANHLKKGE